jgi:hypothetical protein
MGKCVLKITPLIVVIVGAHPKLATAAQGKCYKCLSARDVQDSAFLTRNCARFDTWSWLGPISCRRGKSRGHQRDEVRREGTFKVFVFGQAEHEHKAMPLIKPFKRHRNSVSKCFDAWNWGRDCVRASHHGAHEPTAPRFHTTCHR